jgi:FkbM family methyltransferase
MRAFTSLRDFAFRLRYGFRGVPFRVGDRTIRLDESLRRWNVRSEYQVQRVIIENLNQGDGMLDVGANFGLHTLLAGTIVGSTGEVHAFEPLPANVQILRHHMRLNQLESVVRITPSAISDSPESEVAFFSGAEDLGVTASLASSECNTTRVVVPNTRLDDYLSEIRRPIRLIKIDVEGAELKVLRGGQKVLEKFKPLLVIEVHAFAFPSFGTSLEEFRAFLDGCGYNEEILPGTTLQNGLHYQAVYRQKNAQNRSNPKP